MNLAAYPTFLASHRISARQILLLNLSTLLRSRDQQLRTNTYPTKWPMQTTIVQIPLGDKTF
jgi:hypothetical protein